MLGSERWHQSRGKMSVDQDRRSRRSSLTFKSITRMLSLVDRKGTRKKTDSPKKEALVSVGPPMLPGPGTVDHDSIPPSQEVRIDDSSAQQTPLGDLEKMINSSFLDISTTMQHDPETKVPPPDNGKATSIASGERPVSKSERCDSPSRPDQDNETKTRKRETKRLQKEKGDLEKHQKKREAEEKRESRSAKQGSRRLSKKQPMGSSSRSSSVTSVMRSSTTPVLSSFRRSISGSRGSSSRDIGPSPPQNAIDLAQQTADGSKNTSESGPTMPALSSAWPERFGAAVSRELALGKQPTYSSYSAPTPTERSLHSTGKYSDLRGSARKSQSVTSEQPRVQSMDVSFYQRPVSGDRVDKIGNKDKENQPKDDFRKSYVDPYTLTPCDAPDAEQEQRSESKISGTPRFYANLHNIQALSGSETTIKGVSRQCPPAYVAPGATTRKSERPGLPSSKSTPNTSIERSPGYANAQTNGAQPPNGVKTANSRYTAVFKSSSTPIPTYKRENSQRNSLLPSRLRSKHAIFRSSPLAAPDPDSSDVKSDSWDVNRSAPTLLPGQDLSVKPQSTKSNDTETDQSPSPNDSAVEGSNRTKLQPSPTSSNSSSDLYPQPLTISPSSAAKEHDRQPLRRDAATPLRSYSTGVVTKVPSRKPVGNSSSPSRSVTNPTDSQPRQISVDSAVKATDPAERVTPKSPSHIRTKLRSGVLSVSSEETISELYDTASENISEESQPFPKNALARPISPTFNLFGNGTPPVSASYPTQRNRAPLQADNRPKSTSYSNTGLPANTSAALRHASRAKPLAKMFVICCQCKFWHDMPSEVYAKLAFPSGAPPSIPNTAPVGSASLRSRQFDSANGTLTRRDSVDYSKGGSNARVPVEANTSATKVAPNLTSEERPTTAIRLNDGKSRYSLPPSGSSSSPASVVKCCWCDHGMGKSCCAGWTTIVYLHERHH